MTADMAYNLIGILGVALVVCAHFLLQHDTVQQGSATYLWMNLMSAVFIIVSLTRFWNLASFVINLFWAGISIYGLVRRERKTA